MKLNKLLFFATALILIVDLSSCHKKNKEDNMKENVSGTILLADEFGNKYSDNSGISIKIVKTGTTDTAVATTDTAGKYNMTVSTDNVSGGYGNTTYDGIVQKTGFRTWKAYSTKGSMLIPISYLLQPCTTIMQSIKVDSVNNLDNSTTYNISGTFSPSGTTGASRSVRLFLGKDSLVSPTNYVYSKNLGFINSNSYSYQEVNYNIKLLGFKSGDTIYAVGYGDIPATGNNEFAYFNPDGLGIYYSINDSKTNVVSYKLK